MNAENGLPPEVNEFITGEAPGVTIYGQEDRFRDELALRFFLPKLGAQARVDLSTPHRTEVVAETIRQGLDNLRREVSIAVGLERRVDEIKAEAEAKASRARIDAIDEITTKLGWIIKDTMDREAVKAYLEELRSESRS